MRAGDVRLVMEVRYQGARAEVEALLKGRRGLIARIRMLAGPWHCHVTTVSPADFEPYVETRRGPQPTAA